MNKKLKEMTVKEFIEARIDVVRTKLDYTEPDSEYHEGVISAYYQEIRELSSMLEAINEEI